ncbi:MAG: response regulator [Thermoguttaceae bacterium]|nr:response regulator [Thermoguttaceae bacterium]MDW8078204.1 response regulator [Thermoguttaceae bacterium]
MASFVLRGLCCCGIACLLALPLAAAQGQPGGGGAFQAPAEQAAPLAANPPEGTSAPSTASPAAQAILATNPTFPWECARAAKILADLGEVDLAKGFIKKILVELANQDDATRRATLVDLEERFGAEMFYQMAMRPELAPEARDLAQALGAALDAHRRDIDRLRKLVAQLSDEDVRVAMKAAEDLRRSGGFAVAPLVEGLVAGKSSPDVTSGHFQRRALNVLKQLGEEAVGPLRAILQEGPEPMAAEAASLAGMLRLEGLGPYLLVAATVRADSAAGRQAWQVFASLYGDVPQPEAAAGLLVRQVRQLLNEALAAERGATCAWWFWDHQQGVPEVKQLPVGEVRRREAAFLARAAAQMAPQLALASHYNLLCAAELAGGQGSLREIAEAANKLAKAWDQISCAELIQVFCLGQEHRLPIASAVVLAIVAGRSDERLLTSSHVDPSPVVEALRRADRRVRFFALTAILQHAENCHFAGASWLGETVRFFLASEGRSRALIASANTAEAMTVAGFLVQLGFEVDTVRTGRDAFRLLTNSPDFEVAFLDLGLDDPPVDTLVQQLAADCRSAPVPVGIWARAGTLDRAQQVAARNPMGKAFSRPHSLESIKWQVDELRRLDHGALLARNERSWVAQAILQVLARDIDRTAQILSLSRMEPVLAVQLNFPDRAPAAMKLLGAIGSPTAQTSLVQFASRQSVPEALRREAVQVFGETVSRFGILLTTKQIERQYDLYNQIGPTSPIEREILGAILDAIEGRQPATIQVGAFPP